MVGCELETLARDLVQKFQLFMMVVIDLLPGFISEFVPLIKLVSVLEEHDQNLIELDDLLAGRTSDVHPDEPFILNATFRISEDRLFDLETVSHFKT